MRRRCPTCAPCAVPAGFVECFGCRRQYPLSAWSGRLLLLRLPQASDELMPVRVRCSHCDGMGTTDLAQSLEQVLDAVPATRAVLLREIAAVLKKRKTPMGASELTSRLASLVNHRLIMRFNTDEGLRWERCVNE